MKRRLFLKSTAATASGLSVAGCGGGADSNPGELTPTPITPAPIIPTPTGLPAWRQGMAVGQWKPIPGSALSASPMAVSTYPSLGATGPASKVVAWCGLAIDTRDSSVYSAAGGGHGDYAGNEVNRIRLADDAPAWTESRASTAVGQVRASVSHYADGRPTSRHSYYGVVCNEKRSRVMLMAGSRWGDGYQMDAMDGFDLALNDWDAAATFPHVPSAVPQYYGAAIVEHKSTGDIYALANYSVFKWSNSTNAWTTVVEGGSIYGFEAASALDTRRNRVLVLGGLGDDQGLFTLGTGVVQPVSLSGAGTGAFHATGNGMVYDAALDAYLVRTPGAGAAVFRIDAQTFSVSLFAATDGGAIPAAQNGVYRRFLFAPGLGGVVYCPAYDANLWFLRTA